MPAATTEFRRKQTVVARQDLPGVPAGTTGTVLTSVGLTWVRYRVRFDNGVEIGSIDVEKLAALDDPSETVVGAEPDTSTDPKAVIAFVIVMVGGLVGVSTWIWPFDQPWLAVTAQAIGSLVAVVLAHRSLDTISRSQRRGLPLAIAALLLGYLGLMLAFLGAIFLLAD